MATVRDGLRESCKNISTEGKFWTTLWKSTSWRNLKAGTQGVFELTRFVWKRRWKHDSKTFLCFPVPQHLNKQSKERRKEMCFSFFCFWLRKTPMNLLGSTTNSHPSIQQALLEWQGAERAVSLSVLFPVCAFPCISSLSPLHMVSLFPVLQIWPWDLSGL